MGKIKDINWRITNKLGLGSEWRTASEYNKKDKEWQIIFSEEEFFRFLRKLTKNKIKIIKEEII